MLNRQCGSSCDIVANMVDCYTVVSLSSSHAIMFTFGLMLLEKL